EALLKMLRKLVKPSRKMFLELLADEKNDTAIQILTSAVETFPKDPDYHFYLALVLLRGRNAKGLSFNEALEIENHVRISSSLDPEAAHPYLVWASVRWDFFVTNGFARPEEAWALLQKAADRTLDADSLHAIRSTLRVSKGSPLVDLLQEAG